MPASPRRTHALLLALGLMLSLLMALMAGTPATAAEGDLQFPVPPGANVACKPSKAHPFPVVLANGTFETMAKNWTVLSPQLAAAGYCVFADNDGNSATNAVADSAVELRDFVALVLKRTRVKKVALVGHGQGGMLPRYYLRFLGGRSKVDELVGISPSHHGTTSPLAPPAGSAFLQTLNAGGDTEPGISYTVLTTRYDEVVTPYSSQFLAGPATQVTNVLLQDACPTDLFEHDQTPNDPVVARWVLNALGRPGPADPSFRPAC